MGIVSEHSAIQVNFSDEIHVSFNKEVLLKLTLYLVWGFILLHFSRGFFTRIPFLSDYVDEVIVCFYLGSILLSLPAWMNRFCLVDYIFYFLNVFYFLACYILFPNNEEFLTETATLCIFCTFPCYFVGKVIEIEKVFNTFVLISSLAIIANVLYFFFYYSATKVVNQAAMQDNMWYAYQAMPHVCLLLWASLEKFRIWKLAIFTLGVVFLLSCGTRGPFVCIAFFGIIYFFFYMKFKGAIYFKIGILLLGAILIATLEEVLLFFVQTFTNLKLSTRIIEKIVSGELGNDSHRSVLREKLMSALDSSNHFFGLGIWGCRNYDIIYPHFLPLDFLCSYGYVVGSILLSLLIALIVFAFWVTRGSRNQIFLLFLFSIGLIKLLLSSSFLLEPYFFILVGYCVQQILNKHTKLLLTNNDSARKDSAFIPLETA